jgi:septum formation protein
VPRPSLVLASASPRRRELLEACRIPFRVVVSDAPEDLAAEDEARGPAHVVALLAARKAETVRRMLVEAIGGGAESAESAESWILGADTLVEVDGLSLGKPASAAEARSMIERLSGRTHRVHTGIALIPGLTAATDLESVSTAVSFRLMSEREIDWYVGTGEWRGAAGAYRIQERAAFLVESIHGSYSNVVGLPLEAFYGMLSCHQYDLAGI